MTLKLYQLSCYYLNLIWLNILWVIFTVLGGVVFGIFPATASAFQYYRKHRTEFSGYIGFGKMFRSMWQGYRHEFIATNKLALFAVGIALFLYIDFRLVLTQQDVVSQGVKYLLLIAILIAVVALMFLFPVYNYFKLSTSRYILQTFLLVILSPVQLLKCLILLAGSYLAMIYIPAFILPIYMSLQIKIIQDIMEKRFSALKVQMTTEKAV